MKKFFLLLTVLLQTFFGFAQIKHWPANTVYDIFPGDYADPSILCDGKDYYMTHSTSTLLVWHSTDLLHWKPISRPLSFYSHNAWAPELLKYRSKFFIYYPNMGRIFAVTADNASGPWSTPVDLNISGIDPGIITTAEGKIFMYIDNGRVIELAEDGLSVKGDLKKVYSGWQYPKDWVVECYCLESPKLLFHSGYYYLISAQGGTSGPSTSHMAVAARSKSPQGPWEESPYNPVVHTWSSKDGFASKGHGTIFSDAKGQWYIVYHGYQKGQLPMGRHTLIEPIVWTKDRWPKSTIDKNSPINYITINNTALVSDQFNDTTFGWQWHLSGVDSKDDYSLKGGRVTIEGSSSKIRALQLIGSNANYEASVKIDITGNADAGLALFYNEQKFVGLSIAGGKLSAIRDNRRVEVQLDATGIQYLKVKLDHYDLSLLYSKDGLHWQTYPSGFEMSGYQTNVLRDFGSLRPSIYIKGEGKVTVSDFKYKSF